MSLRTDEGRGEVVYQEPGGYVAGVVMPQGMEDAFCDSDPRFRTAPRGPKIEKMIFWQSRSV